MEKKYEKIKKQKFTRSGKLDLYPEKKVSKIHNHNVEYKAWDKYEMRDKCNRETRGWTNKEGFLTWNSQLSRLAFRKKCSSGMVGAPIPQNMKEIKQEISILDKRGRIP